MPIRARIPASEYPYYLVLLSPHDNKNTCDTYSRGTEVLVKFGCRCNTEFVWEHHTKPETLK
jgi:hypothetical protein